VAKLAEVSVGTVSNVLNGISSVKKGVRQRVLSAIEELDYHPNRAARSLAGGRSHTFAFILPDICNPFFPEMVRGAMESANQASFDVFLANIDNDPQKEINYIDSFVKRGVDGLIIATSDLSSKQSKHISALSIPVVIVDRELPGLSRDLVMVDNYDCAYQAADHLLDLGHRHIGVILGPEQTMTTRTRLKGARDALQEAGLFDPGLVRYGSYSIDSGHEAMRAIMRKGGQLSAVFCANDLLAIGAIKAVQESGLKVPVDVSVIGIDDIMLSSLVNPALTTIRQPTFDLGAMAAKLLIQRIQDNDAGVHRKVILPGELIIRNSTGPLKGSASNGGSR
jgi:LacI family transcriptional regulator